MESVCRSSSSPRIVLDSTWNQWITAGRRSSPIGVCLLIKSLKQRQCDKTCHKPKGYNHLRTRCWNSVRSYCAQTNKPTSFKCIKRPQLNLKDLPKVWLRSVSMNVFIIVNRGYGNSTSDLQDLIVITKNQTKTGLSSSHLQLSFVLPFCFSILIQHLLLLLP